MNDELFCRIRLVGTNLYYDRRKGSYSGEVTNFSLTGNFYKKSNVKRAFDEAMNNSYISDKQIKDYNLKKITKKDYGGNQNELTKNAKLEIITYKLLEVEN